MKLKFLLLICLLIVPSVEAKKRKKHHRAQVKVTQPCVIAKKEGTPAEAIEARIKERGELSGRTIPTNRNPCQ